MSDYKDEILYKADVLRDNQECHTFPQVKIDFEYPPAHLVEVGSERLFRKIQKLSNEEKFRILQFLWCELNDDLDPKNLKQFMEGNFEETDKVLNVKSSQNLFFFAATTLFIFGVEIILGVSS